MLKNPSKWAGHKLIGPMDPDIMFLRHEEQVAEFVKRGYNHNTPITVEQVCEIDHWRVTLNGIGIGDMLVKGQIIAVEKMHALQIDYLQKRMKEV